MFWEKIDDKTTEKQTICTGIVEIICDLSKKVIY